MSADGRKLSVYFGEGDRAGGRLLSDALMDLLARHEALASVLLRGVEGFGITQRLRTDRLLSLSEDLPLVVVAVDTRARIDRLVEPVTALLGGGLVTVERVALPDHGLAGDPSPPAGDEDAKLTVYCGRGEERDGRPVLRTVLDVLRGAGLSGATVLAGLDGTVAGERRRARFLSRNTGVPAMVLSVGPGAALAAALPRLRALLPGRHVITLERVRVVRHDGRVTGDLPAPPAADPGGLALWQRVSVFAGERERWEGGPLHARLVRRLREADAAGVTVLRGLTGFSQGGPVHADHLWGVRRRTPVLVTMIDTVPEIARLWPVVARATASAGLVTCEVVPAARAAGPGAIRGGLRLADTSAP
ncbi:DUF190 domain-containing protein [Miltoncostaea oceani]|uniref:DUF190 domain-containing protein n=1 Tax=Miltoncostaea oceani TaxID=2843216 RepID=UPI001C3D3031|nr:DUF190 domain-containing protein [Miltoncostaea oceani]